ncbi:hypothetical protein P12x_005916 [Tundrisphaera lichenicola]|uniref:hypothetical protein n=1 Tax=Tundrisphaera lichenicola TaxID=2029860 RepID=UPI003EBD3800
MMRLPRFRLDASMFGVILVALNLAAVRYIYQPVPGDISHHNLFMSLWPMGNALAIVLVRAASRGGLKGHPFARGFVIGGSAMMVAYLLCDQLLPDTASSLYSLPRRPFIRFCRAHLPDSWFVWTLPNGVSYFRFYALFSLLYAWPQFVVAGLCGMIGSRVARSPGRAILA